MPTFLIAANPPRIPATVGIEPRISTKLVAPEINLLIRSIKSFTSSLLMNVLQNSSPCAVSWSREYWRLWV